MDNSNIPKGLLVGKNNKCLKAAEVLIKGHDVEKKFAVVDQYFGKGEKSVLHLHTREDHFAEVMEGSFMFRFDNCNYKCEKDSWIYIPRMMWHEFEALDVRNIMRIFIFPSGLEELFVNTETENRSLDNIARQFGIKIKNENA